MACDTGGEFGREIVQNKPSGHIHLRNFAGAMKLPAKGTASDGITKEKAFVPLQVARVPWDKSRKVRPVGRSGNASKFNQARNIAKTGRNLPFLIERCSSSAFGTFGRIR